MKTKMIISIVLLAAVAVGFFQSCSIMPKGAVAVKPFDSRKYLGK